MQLNSTYSLYRLMNKGQYLLCYSGYLAQNQITALLALAERKMQRESTDSQVRRKVFNVMIECLQAFCKNESERSGNIFVLGKADSHYEILSSFNCDYETGHWLSGFIDGLDGLDRAAIREEHKKMMVREFSHPSMASFYSLLDIALKSASPLEYDYEEHSTHMVFSIKTIIPC